jgi:sec-independent protein translocase protein TatC
MADTSTADFTATPGEDEERELTKMSFLEHLEELRKRLIVSIVAVGVAFLVCWNFADKIFGWLQIPLTKFLPKGEKLVYTRLTEPFMLYMKVAAFAGIFVASPIILWQLWLFIAPGLYKRERKMVIPFLISATTLFYAGASFCYFLVMPYAFPALAAIAGADMKPILTMTEQLSLILAMLLGFGVIFEVPVVIAFLSMIGLVSADFLAKYRRHAIVANTAIAAIITPTGDPFNLALMALPMILFYEIGIILARILGKKKPAAAT